MLRNKSIIKWSLIISILQILILYIIFGFIIYTFQREIIKKNEIDKIKLFLEIHSKYIKTYLEKNDDISLLNTLKEITNKHKIYYAQIIDLSGKIIAHNNIHKWNTTLHFQIPDDVISSDFAVLKKLNDCQSYNYFIPIKLTDNRKVFFLTSIKLDGLKKNIEKTKSQIVMLCCFLFISTIALNIMFFYITTLMPLKKTNMLLKSLILDKSGEKINCSKINIFHDTYRLINELIDKYVKEIALNKKTDDLFLKGLNLVLEYIGSAINYGLILTDTKNIVIYINKKAREILNIPEENVSRKHIIELLKTTPKIIELYSYSLNNPEYMIEKSLPDLHTSIKIKNIEIENKSNVMLLILEKQN